MPIAVAQVGNFLLTKNSALEPRGVLFHPLPVRAFSFFAEGVAVQDFSDDFRRLKNRHSGTVEKQIAVGEGDVSPANGLKFRPPGMPLQRSTLAQATLKIKSAGRDNQALGIGLGKLLSRDGGGMYSLVAQ